LILSFRPMGKPGSSLQSIAKVAQLRYRVTFYEAFRVLEPFAVKVARTVLRRERRGNPPDLSDSTDTNYLESIQITVDSVKNIYETGNNPDRKAIKYNINRCLSFSNGIDPVKVCSI
jgi:hypothetical protein